MDVRFARSYLVFSRQAGSTPWIIENLPLQRGCNAELSGKCGATVFFAWDGRPSEFNVAAGLLRASEGVMAEEWIL